MPKTNERMTRKKATAKGTRTNRIAELVDDAPVVPKTNGRVTRKKVTAKITPEIVDIPQPMMRTINATICGTTSYLASNVPPGLKDTLLATQQKKPKGQSAKPTENELFSWAKYQFPVKRGRKVSMVDGIPATAIKESMVGSCRLIDGLEMTKARLLFKMKPDPRIADPIDKVSGHMLYRLRYKECRLHQRFARNKTNQAMIVAITSEYIDWWVEVFIEFFESQISSTSILYLLQIGGMACGVGAHRNEKKGTHGAYEVVSEC